MSGFPPLLYFLLGFSLCLAQNEQDDYFKTCPTVTCGFGSESLQIRFPFRLPSAPISCGVAGFELTCSGNDTLLSLPSLPPFKVTDIYYGSLWWLLTIRIGSGFGSLSSSCPFQHPYSLGFLSSPSYHLYRFNASLVNCSEDITLDLDSNTVSIPISCLSGSGYFVYIIGPYETMDNIPSSCVVVRNWVEVPFAGRDMVHDLQGLVEHFEEKREVSMSLNLPEKFSGCWKCESEGKPCGYSSERNQTFCQRSTHHGLRVALITGASISGFLIVVTVTLSLLYIYRQSIKDKETRIKVERFLATYKADKPTRYTYSGIKKITKRFRHKLGQGGFGSVYKGELPNGLPVAVKLMEGSKDGEQEFINEVSAMGRIHHTNVVRLLGFCSEGSTHALIYEFMQNESLEKFIFHDESRRNSKPFSMEKLQDIAIGIAQGIEYLHQGCDQRILHFDIKPHNILLDNSCNPKISDFGLAKLCPKDYSVVTLTAARGTMGYIAPEVYSRNFGSVSYKSDVYSFGILLLEMVSGRRTVDPEIENQSEVYFPEWAYNRLVQREDIGLATDKDAEYIIKKLVIVALWCIQWNPTDRPTMTRVVQLLMGNLESLQIPPKPFASSSGQDGASISEE